MEFRPAEAIKGYHVHIYYDGATKQWAGHLRRELAKLFPAAEIVPWLALNRGELDMLVHPNTGDGYEDHAINCMWVGSSLDLRLDYLKKMRDKRIAEKAQKAA